MDTAEEPGGGILARTVIQPDGDVVCFATARYCDDARVRTAHGAHVADWYEKAESTIRVAAGVMAKTSVALGVALGTLFGGLSGIATGGLRGVVLALATGLGVSAGASALAHRGLRRLAGSVLGGR